MTELNIVPECEVDTRLVQILGDFKRPPNHGKGHGKVANKLKDNLKDKPALAIIDFDKISIRKSYYFESFVTITNIHNLILKKHHSLKHYLVLINPAIEVWLLENAAISNTTPEHLVNNLADLINFTKTKNIHSNYHFTAFIKQLIQQKAPGITTLKQWIENFISNQELL